MNSFYIYSYQYKTIEKGEHKLTSVSVIFCSCEEIDQKDLQAEIRVFYENHYQTDQIFILGSNNIISILKDVFLVNQEQTFKGIPKRQETHLSENLFLLTFDKDGNLMCQSNKAIPSQFEKTFKNEGLQQIFVSRGGLIVSESSHHYVFPSGKHCDRFLRTGNILLYSPEIYFIAFTLLKHFREQEFSRIYCDTSSINSIAFALFDLKNSFLSDKSKVSIESFSSYDGLYKKPDSYTKDSFLLVSASTSANIIKYILDRHKIIDRDNIIILYFLATETDFSNVKDQVLCNLTKSDYNNNGIDFYPTYSEKDCEFCKKGSYPVPVSGDVFLLEKPAINKILLATTDRDKNLSPFVFQFMSQKKKDSVFKVHYKEQSSNKYEVYIDYTQILNGIEVYPKYSNYRDKLNIYIQQYIPVNTKYILCLNDEGSEKLAIYILDKIKPFYKTANIPEILKQDDLPNMDETAEGAVVVVGSCVSNGKNLLYISRALRKFNKLRIAYFVGIARTQNNEYLLNLKRNLQRGKYGAANNIFIEVETMYCSNLSKNSPWIAETDFLKDMILFITNIKPKYQQSLEYFQKRKQTLEEGSGNVEKGLAEGIFYPRITCLPFEELHLRKNFAFFDFDNYDEHVTQSDVFFTISNIINSLRNSKKTDRQLKQAVYVRNLIAPANFDRFNDGVIQSSILRAALSDELAYAIDPVISLEMYNTLETIVKYNSQEQGEALLEFLYAIAVKKLSLSVPHLESLLEKIKASCQHELFNCFADYIQEKLIDAPLKLKTLPLESRLS